MEKYSVKALSKLAGVSVRTLHYYDQIGLLKPLIRTEAGYRLYGTEELIRLQQILFYRELDFQLKEICDIMDDPEFDLTLALSNHKSALLRRRDRIDTLIATIDKTINHQSNKEKVMLKPEELYEGLSKEAAQNYRTQAIEKYGKEAVRTSEQSLMKLSKQQIADLKKEQQEVTKALFMLKNEDHTSNKVQQLIQRHYSVTRKFWGTDSNDDPQAEQYAGLGELYKSDERFTLVDGKPQPEFAQFLSEAMRHFSKTQLK